MNVLKIECKRILIPKLKMYNGTFAKVPVREEHPCLLRIALILTEAAIEVQV